MGDSFWRMINRCHTEVMLVINQEEAHWNITYLIQRMNNFGTYHQTRVFANLKLRNVNNLICRWFFGFFDESIWQNLRYRFNHVDDSVCLQSALISNGVVRSRHKPNNIVAFFICLQIWIDSMGLLEISNCFIISLKIF